MTTLVRQLSFGRRRKKGGVTHPQCDEVKRGAASQKEQTPTEGDSEETLSEGDGRVGAPWVLVPLCSSLKKKHHNATVFSSPAQRWFEVDDLLGVMYQFKDRSSMERRTPHHVYALGDISRVSEGVSATANAEGAFTFAFTTGDDVQTGTSSCTPSYLSCISDNRSVMHRWLSGMQARLAKQQEYGAPRARSIWVDTFVGRAPDPTTNKNAPSEADASDSDDEGAAAKGATAKGKAAAGGSVWGSTDGSPRAPQVRAAPTYFLGRPKARGIGISCNNVKWSPIGAELSRIEDNSPAELHGLQVGDVVVAVNGQACYSHVHTCRLIGESYNPIELIVWRPRGAPLTGRDEEPVELS